VKKLDLKKELRELYSAKREASIVLVPKQKIIAVEGQGDPNTSQEFQNAVEALFPVAFKIKFASKKQLDRDYVVMPLEGLWWTDDMENFSVKNKEGWNWKVFIVQPDFITKDLFEQAIEDVLKAKKPKAISKIKFDFLEEKKAAQILHVGPYSQEGPTIEKLHDYIANSGFTFDGVMQKHHEIYLSDMRKTAPAKFKTIIRQPVAV